MRKLSAAGRLLLLYFITNPHTHISGLYYLPKHIAIHETGLQAKAFDTLSDTLSSLGFCSFDPERELIWVRHMMHYQGRGEKNLRSAAHHVMEDLHYSPLILEFLKEYPKVKALIPDTVCDRVSSVGTPNSRSLNPESLILNPESPILNPESISHSSRPAARERAKDPAYEVFAEAHHQTLDAAYMSNTGDFVQLNRLRKAHNVGAREPPPHWEEAVKNYFSSVLAKYGLADLCVRYAVFRNGSVDRFGKLGGSGEQGRQQRTKQAIKKFIGDVDGDI